MRLGLISDVHSNFPALEAVLQSLELRGVDAIVCSGDLLGYGPHPQEVIAAVREKNVVCVLGAADVNIAFPFAKTEREGIAEQIIDWTHDQLSPEDLAWLRKLPVTYRMTTPAGRLRSFHGFPYQPEKRFPLSKPTAELLPVFGRLGSDILVSGGSHIPFHRRIDDYWLIDPGSVGMTLGGEPGADAMVLDFEDGSVQVEVLKVPYDIGQTVFDVRAWGLPEIVAEVIHNGGRIELPEED